MKSGDWTKVTFKPNFKRIKMNTIEDDSVALPSKQAYDIVVSMTDIAQDKCFNVYLNGTKLKVKISRIMLVCTTVSVH